MNLDLMGFFSTNNLLRLKDGVYVINLNSNGKRWIYLFIVKYIYDSFRTEYIPQEVLSKINYSQYINNTR